MPKAAFWALDLSVKCSRPYFKTDKETRETVNGDFGNFKNTHNSPSSLSSFLFRASRAHRK